MGGVLEKIYLASAKAEPLLPVGEAEAIAGKGLTGDRYATGQGTFSNPTKTDREITLIEAEAIDAVARDYTLTLEPGEARRNLVTRGVALNHLVGKRFHVGTVLLEGIRLCEPCKHLEKLTQKNAMRALIHRGGLRARIIRGGRLRVGDAIEPS